MSEDKNPIFPRSSERSDLETNELRQKTKQNLEITEHFFEQKITCSKCQTESFANAKFCRVCGGNLSQASLSYENGRFELTVSRRLPPPYNDLNEGQRISILDALDSPYQNLLLIPFWFMVTETVQLNGDCFILLSLKVLDPDDHKINYPQTIAKLDMYEVVLEILSHQTFLDVVAEMQKKIDENLPAKVVESVRKRDVSYAIWFLITQLNRKKKGQDEDIHTTPLEFATEPTTNAEQQFEITKKIEPPAMMLENNLEGDYPKTVYGPPPMPMIAPAYGPPPMRLTDPSSKLFWLGIGLLLVFFITAIVFLILFFIFR